MRSDKVLTGIIFILALWMSALYAGETLVWPHNGVPVRQGVHIEWQRAVAVAEPGYLLLAWSDARTGDRDVYVQKIDTTGQPLWDSTGVQVVSVTGRQEDPLVLPDGLGGAYVAWIDYREDEYGDVYAQHVNAQGELEWDPTGVPVAVNSGAQQGLNGTRGPAGYAYLIWWDTHLSEQGDVFGTVLTPDGPLATGGTDGLPLITATGTQTAYSIETVGQEAVVVWEDGRDAGNLDIYGQRVDLAFQRLWGEQGILICGAGGAQQQPKVFGLPEGRAAICWKDGRNHTLGDIYLQVVDSTGQALWATDGIAVTDLMYGQEKARIKANSSRIYLVWEDYRNNPQEADIYAQAYDFTGQALWEEGGKPLVSAPLDQGAVRLTLSSQGGIDVVWQDERQGGYPLSDIYFQHVSPTGELQFLPDGLPLTSSRKYQEGAVVRPDGTAGAFIIWGDASSGSLGIVGQHVTYSAGPTWDADGMTFFNGIDGDAAQAQAMPWGEQDFLVFWEDHRRASQGELAMAQVMDRTGGILHTLNGEALSSNAQQLEPVLAPDNQGGAYLAFINQTLGVQNLYLAHLNSQLQPTWDSSGVRVYDQNFLDQRAAVLAPLPDGSVVLFWSEMRTFAPFDIFAQRFTPDGTAVWTPGGVMLTESYEPESYARGAVVLPDGNIICVWETVSTDDENIYLTSLDPDGNINWTVVVTEAAGIQSNPRLVFNPVTDSLYVAWEDPRNILNGTDLYLRAISRDGNAGNEWAFAAGPGDQSQLELALSDDGSGVLYAAWSDFSDGVQHNLWVRNLTVRTPAVQVTDLSTEELHPALRVISAERFLLAWEDYRGGIHSDIYLYDSDPAGAAHVTNGIVVCDAVLDQTDPQIVPFADSSPEIPRYAIVWEDKRSSGKSELQNIYAQAYYDVNVGVEPSNIPRSFVISSPYPNPFNGLVRFSVEIPETGLVTWSIYDLQGRVIYQRSDQLSAGRHNLFWRGINNYDEAVGSGVYLLVVNYRSRVFTHKLLYIK